MRIENFAQATEYLHSFVDFERRGFRRWAQEVVSLDTMRRLAALLRDPQDDLCCVHIAGTKGKGSTAAMLEAALRAAGCTTGLYTSPHLVSPCERICINGEPISETALTELVCLIQPAAEELRDSDQLTSPTFFEIYTGMGLLAFARARVDIAIIETGLGGRLDATNIIAPLLTVITTVGFDHTEILGDTLAAIAGEKAGIIKPGVPVICAPQEPEAGEVIRQRADELQSPYKPITSQPVFERARPVPVPETDDDFSPPRQQFTLQTDDGSLEISTPLLGRHQALNAALAYEAVVQLRSLGWRIEAADFQHGLAELHWPGRFEVRQARPWLVLDCAHNEPSTTALAAALPEYLQFRRLILILGISQDKDAAAIASRLAPLADHVILTQARLRRAMLLEDLHQRTAGIWLAEPELIPRVRAALDRARQIAGPHDCICVTGSFFVVGEAVAYIEGLPEDY